MIMKFGGLFALSTLWNVKRNKDTVSENIGYWSAILSNKYHVIPAYEVPIEFANQAFTKQNVQYSVGNILRPHERIRDTQK